MKVHHLDCSKLTYLAFLFPFGLALNPALADEGTAPESSVAEAASDNETVESTDLLLDEIIIAGDKVERSEFDTVTSVGVITGEELDEQGITSTQEVFTRLANVSSSSGGEGFAIRGMRHFSVGGGGRSGIASFYIDGAYLNSFAIRVGPTQLYDVSGVEVFRGPQATSQGRSAIAGVVNVLTRDPQFNWGGSLRLRGEGNDELDTYIASAAFGGPISESLAFRLVADERYDPGDTVNETTGNDEYAHRGSTTLRGKLRYMPSAWQGADIVLGYGDYKNESGDDFVDASDPFARKSFSNIEGREDNDLDMLTIKGFLPLSDQWDIRFTAADYDSFYDRLDDDDQSAAGGRSFRKRTDEVLATTGEIRLHFDYERVRGHFGYFNFQEFQEDLSPFVTGNTARLVTRQFPLDPLDFIPDDVLAVVTDQLLLRRDQNFTRDTDNQAVFTEVHADVSDRLTVFAGYRYDRELQNDFAETTISLENSATGAIIPVTRQGPVTSEFEFTASLPKVGATVTLGEDYNIKLTSLYSEAYRPGGSAVSPTTGYYSYDPEYVKNYELSFRSLFFNQRLAINSNIFYMDWRDQQVLVINSSVPGDFSVENAGSSELYGAELGVRALLTQKLTSTLTYGYVDTEFTEFTNANADFSGNEFPGAPRHNASLTLDYRGFDGLYGTFNVNYRDFTYMSPSNNEAQIATARTLLSLRAGYRLATDNRGTYDLALYGNNLTDDEYTTFDISNVTGSLKVGKPRTYGIELRMLFGAN